MISAVPEGQEFASWLICDHRFQRRYGSRYSRPAPMPLFPHIRSGYLKTGKTIEDLGLAHGIDPHGLRATTDDRRPACCCWRDRLRDR